MDFKDDEKSLKYQEHPNIASRYFESNAGHLFVNNVNPFNSVGGYAGNVKENHVNIKKNEEFLGVFDNSTPKDPNDTASAALVNEIMKNYTFNKNYMFMNEPYDDINEALIHEAFIAGNQKPDRLYSHPAIAAIPANISYSTYDTTQTQNMTSSSRGPKTSRYGNQVKFEENDEHNITYTSNKLGPTEPTVANNGRAEKTTYCRPLCNMYNQEFVYKTVQRNARLQKLVRKLVIARESEKQREAWNNYINDLKNKHKYYSNEPSRISPQYVPEEHHSPELINDFYNTRFNWRQSNPCQHLLQDFYGNNNNMTPNTYNKYLHEYDKRLLSDIRPDVYETNRFCYPTSSQANIMRINRERYGNNYGREWRHQPSGRYYRGNTILVEKESLGNFDRVQGTRRVKYGNTRFNNGYSRINYGKSRQNLDTNSENLETVTQNKEQDEVMTSSKQIQTDLPVTDKEKDEKDETDEHKQETFKDKFKRVTANIARLKSKMRYSEAEPKKDSLGNIEDKIDNLMKSINTIMVDIKSNKNIFRNRKNTSVSCRFVTTSQNHLNRPKSDPYGLMNNEEYFSDTPRDSCKSLLSEVGSNHIKSYRESSASKMDKIILEEMKKSNKVKRDIEELLNLRNDRNCSVQITFDIPTRERSTEVTDSLSKAKQESGHSVVVEEIPSKHPSERTHAQMTIAVNTDPLGLLALLRVSTETIKQLLSYMPNLNYNSYLSMLQLPSKRCVSHYICNICGAAFGRPSQLSDHIQQHNLGRTRDCCVCRHSLDLRRAHVDLFACRYCGQRFTRAYCCELHQQSCARHLGRHHDVRSSHVLLR